MCFRKGFENVDLVSEADGLVGGAAAEPEANRYHGFEGTDYFWRNDDGDVDADGRHA